MISNAMDSFTLPTEGFDGPLLPEEARVVGSPEFQSAVSGFFESLRCIVGEAALDCHGDPGRVGGQVLAFTKSEAMVRVVGWF
jgi:hypothetical protein